jgi:hypothetical protein
MEREKGASPFVCPNCGGELKDVVQADGSLTHEPCEKCYGPKSDKAPEVSPNAPVPPQVPTSSETASLNREVGSQVAPASTTPEGGTQ